MVMKTAWTAARMKLIVMTKNGRIYCARTQCSSVRIGNALITRTIAMARLIVKTEPMNMMDVHRQHSYSRHAKKISSNV